MPADNAKTPVFRHILVPTDGSPASLRAAAGAMALAKATGGRVTGFFAAPPATPVVFGRFLPKGYLAPDEHAAMIAKMTDRYLGKLAKLAAEAGVPFAGVHRTSDYPAEAILEVARERKCDLICIAPHTRQSIAGALLGSQTHKVVVQAKIPVLVYR
ncbi:MAG: universal stress protein [Betaproteobacteria bacterium]|jgi:nucleotide-binding universal stress UspA family protein|nr:universal stress protein [Betaproteobacteria bacterium]